MTLPRTVADVLTDHVVFEVECIDRMYCNVYVPQLQHAGGLLGYIQRQLGLPIASTAPLGKITDAFSAAMRRFARDQRVPWVDFAKGQRKDDVMHEHLAGFAGTEGVLFIGRAQEKTALFRTEKRRDAEGNTYPWIVKATGLVNHFYVYAVDADFGPFFLKFCSYFPYNGKLCLNGHEWAKRQATNAGIGHTALDNAFATVDDVAAVQAICHRLGPEQIDALLRKWLARLPHPFTPADRAAGYRYDLSILQAEFSRTQMLDRPVSGRIFFEQVIRDNLDLGRPARSGWSSTGGCRAPPPDGSAPGCSPTRSLPACTWTTSTPRSSSITRKAGRYAPRPPSTTPATFASASGCRTCPRCGRSASRPTDVCSTSNGSATTRPPVNGRSPRSTTRSWSTGSGWPGCASPTRGCRRCFTSC